MNGKVLANEFAKMRRLHVRLLTGVLLVAVIGIAVYTSVFNPDFDRATQGSWNTLIGGTASGMTLAAPLLLAVIASRQVDIEHQGNGWLLTATSGVTPGGLCRAKLLSLGALVAGVTLLASALVAATGLLLGIEAPFPAARWIGSTAALLGTATFADTGSITALTIATIVVAAAILAAALVTVSTTVLERADART